MYRRALLSSANWRVASSSRRFNSSIYSRNVRRRAQRYFSQETKETVGTDAKTAGTGKVHDSAPPPPPPSSGGGAGMWILLTAAVAGGAYYFRDEIMEFTGMGSKEKTKGSSDQEVSTAVKDVPATKQAIEKAEKTLKEVAATSTPKETPTPKPVSANSEEVDWAAVKEAIVEMLDDEDYDYGSYGPVFVRLAWHSAGTYDKNTKKGGTEGAAMRFNPEAGWGANAGLSVARAMLEPIKAKFPQVSYSDLWSLAGTVSIEEMGGPEIKWRPGRKDCNEGENPLPDGLLPDADGREYVDEPQKHVREIFERMGFNDQEMVCLIGAHCLGGCHVDRSGYWGPWSRAPTTFSNEYFRLLLEETWSKKKTHEGKAWTGPEQYEDPTGDLMMLPADMCLVWDPKFKKYVELYAKDEDKFFKDFAKAWTKLQENGVRAFHGWRRYILFGPRE